MVIALDFHLDDPGSIPGSRLNFILFLSLAIDLVSKKLDFKWLLFCFPSMYKDYNATTTYR